MTPADPLAPGEYAPEVTYLNTASHGLLPARGRAVLETVQAGWSSGRSTPGDYDHLVPELRASFARLLTGATADDIAIGGTVAGLIGRVAAALPAGAEVLVAEGDFASVPNPFRFRGDLDVRAVPLEKLAVEVRAETALIAVSLTQSADGRTVDPAALRAAAHANGARLLIDATQAAGWLPLRFADADFWVCASFKWLLGARSVSLLAVQPEALDGAVPVGAGWYAGADPWGDMYGAGPLAATAHRLDDTPDWLGVAAAIAGLGLVHELGVAAIGAHDRTLAAAFRAGLAELGLAAVPGDTPIVTVPGAAAHATALAAGGVVGSARGGGLRVSFHLYNTGADVERALAVLREAGR
ncbi:aminotransferase class V-fold PLP-dependent enzyme [Nocardia asteroides]|uniref:aminotransferase class V-fold PLP-dependent enzyme n=1 Tax=Nocardia asteroides TaxID=1824 RepID=UPI001E29ADA5|nr:aminotransferase class V-fold PLP-dependent enzyme [Nocardia asteroides]UGT62361.1 aminotransferase class V-fold PLP-dependent enzyme [Nocardia asteroides]